MTAPPPASDIFHAMVLPRSDPKHACDGENCTADCCWRKRASESLAKVGKLLEQG